jgi:hypothetical protein
MATAAATTRSTTRQLVAPGFNATTLVRVDVRRERLDAARLLARPLDHRPNPFDSIGDVDGDAVPDIAIGFSGPCRRFRQSRALTRARRAH